MEKRRKFTREFKLEAVRLIRERGVSYAQASADLGVHPTQLRHWVKQLADDPQHAFPGQGQMKPEQLDIAQLKREVLKLTDRPASWWMPTRKQMEKMAANVGRKASPARGLPPDADLPPEYWQAILNDVRADAGRPGPGATGSLLQLRRIPQHILRVGCRRCGRTVDIQKADAARLYGPDAIWKDVGQRLLDKTCSQRTGRLEEDGCWPTFDLS